MFETIERAVARVREVWNAMTLNQKVISGAIIASLVLVTIFLSTLGGISTKYTVIAAQLNPKDAVEITRILDQQKVTYRVTQNGTAVEVPVDQADRLKMDLSAQGLPGSGIVGYEILDSTNFSMSDFLQKVNYRRAMEGELARTLRTLEAVEDASVKIATPEPSLYSDTQQPTTASVMLKLRRGRTLPDRSVEAITNLVASSIEGLDPQNVTVVDTRGNLLTRPSRDALAMMSSTQMEMKVSVDRYLAEKIRGMLNGAFGPGKALVNVNADLDFDKMERTSTTYDQEKSAIVSEERLEVTNKTDDGGGEENTVTNYNNGSVVEKLAKSPGSISKLTVSVMLDGRDSTVVDAKGKSTIKKVPWTAQQLISIKTITENAVGFNPQRGDRVDIEYMEFSGGEEGRGERLAVKDTIVEAMRAFSTGLVILAALGILFLAIRAITRSLDPTRIKLPSEADFEKKKAELIKVEDEVKETEKSVLVRKIVSKAIKDPEMIAKSLKTFYREDTTR